MKRYKADSLEFVNFYYLCSRVLPCWGDAMQHYRAMEGVMGVVFKS